MTFIGGGTMGEAMVSVLSKKVAKPENIVVSDVSQLRRELLNREYGVGTLADNREAIKGADLIILSVKPQDLSQVMQEIKNFAGASGIIHSSWCQFIQLMSRLKSSSVIRAMPNMPAQIGQGMTVWTTKTKLAKNKRKWLNLFLSAFGEEIYVADEKYIDMATALSGSGPAYVFLFIEALIDAGVHIGLPRDIAQKLVIETLLGSTLLCKRRGNTPPN